MPYPRDLTVIVVSYNTRERLIDALTAICAGEDVPSVVVIDNASRDGSADAVSERFPRVKLIRSPDNLGFARGANLGLAGLDTRYGVLLNPDTLPTPGLLKELVQYLEANPDVWAVAPRLLRPNGRPQSMDAGFRPTAGRAWVHFLGLAELLPLDPKSSFCVPSRMRQPMEVDWLSGACLCLTRHSIEVAGPLDPSFFLYGEDLDWCRRVQKQGGRLVLRGDLGLPHSQGASSGHDVRSPDWLSALDRGYITPYMGRAAAGFFTAAAFGFGLRAVRALLPGYARRPATLAGYARAAAVLSMKALRGPASKHVSEPLARHP